jgi:hypothetical protein
MNKRNIIITIVVIILVIVAAVATTSKKKMAQEQATTTPDTAVSADSATPTTAKPGPKASPTLSRKEALDFYQDKIVRITNDCSADSHTYSFNLKKGDKIMLDNDSDKSHTVLFAGVNYAISAHGYRTATLQNDGMVSSTCNPQTGVTTVMVTAAQ